MIDCMKKIELVDEVEKDRVDPQRTGIKSHI